MKPCTFEEAVRLYEGMIRNQMKKLCIYRNYDEFYQCGLIALWKAYEQFDENKGVFPAYALSTVRGTLLTKLNGERQFAERHTMLEPQVADVLPFEEREDYFQHYLAPLHERQRRIIEDRFYYGKKLTTIAEEQGMTYEQVRSLYRRALLKIKEYAYKQGLV